MSNITSHDSIINALLCGDAEMITLRWMGARVVTVEGSLGAPPLLQLAGNTSNYQKVLSAKKVWLKELFCNVYDMGISDGATGALKDIQDSIATLNDAYVQSRFRGAAMFDYQPNYFNPVFRVNGTDILQSDPGEPVGMPIPFHIEPYRPLDKVNSIEISARAAQEVNGQFVVYPAFAFAVFYLMFK
jgi:hypothetical protein